jgi:hypothetical protein
MSKKHVVILWIFLCGSFVWAQSGKPEAERVWKEMLAAKGDMSGVRTLRVLEDRSSLFAAKRTTQVVMARLPGEWWWYFEEPKPLWDGLRVFNLERQAGWEWSGMGGGQGQVSDMAKRTAREGNDAEDSYMVGWGTTIETRTLAVLFGAVGTFQPEPVAVEALHEGLRTRDRLTTRWRQFTLVYDIDRESHMPVQVDLQTKLPARDLTSHPLNRPSETRHVPERTWHEMYAMRGYHRINGLMVPERIRMTVPGTSSGGWARLGVEINPQLNPALFMEAPRVVEKKREWTRFAGTR